MSQNLLHTASPFSNLKSIAKATMGLISFTFHLSESVLYELIKKTKSSIVYELCNAVTVCQCSKT